MRSRLVLLAAAAGLAVWLTYRGLVTSALGQRLDQRAMVGSMAATPVEASQLRHVLNVVSRPSVAVAIAALAAVAVRRSRPELAAAAAVMVAGANLTTQALKHLLNRPDLLGLGYENSFPSGHVTVVASLAAGALLVSAPRARVGLAVVGAAATAVTGVATIALGWHRPSDVAGAVGVVAAWTALGAAWAAGKASDLPAPSGRIAVRSMG